MGTFLLRFFQGGRHGPQSRPFTLDNQTYKVCLSCGRVFHLLAGTYDAAHLPGRTRAGDGKAEGLQIDEEDRKHHEGIRSRLHLRAQPLKSTLHIGDAGSEPYPRAYSQIDHRASSPAPAENVGVDSTFNAEQCAPG
jgi:hypothetical protein